MTTTTPPRFQVLASHVRALDDDTLNDLLLDLPPNCYARLLDRLTWPVHAITAVATTLRLRYRHATPKPGETAAWVLLARTHTAPAASPWIALGRLARLPARRQDLRSTADGWLAWTVRGWTRGEEPVAWQDRHLAAVALAWANPASGARCAALAALVRALGDTALNDLLVELPTARFDALCDAAFPAAAELDPLEEVA